MDFGSSSDLHIIIMVPPPPHKHTVGALAGAAGAAEGVSIGSGRVYESPCTTGMVEMMTRACRLAEIPLRDVDYIGTPHCCCCC